MKPKSKQRREVKRAGALSGADRARVEHLLRCQNIRLNRVAGHLSNGAAASGQREVSELNTLVETLRSELLKLSTP